MEFDTYQAPYVAMSGAVGKDEWRGRWNEKQRRRWWKKHVVELVCSGDRLSSAVVFHGRLS